MADWGGFEPPTPWFVAKYSIQLSYQSAPRRVGLNTQTACRKQALKLKKAQFPDEKIYAAGSGLPRFVNAACNCPGKR